MSRKSKDSFEKRENKEVVKFRRKKKFLFFSIRFDTIPITTLGTLGNFHSKSTTFSYCQICTKLRLHRNPNLFFNVPQTFLFIIAKYFQIPIIPFLKNIN